jgi:MFS family permease
MMAVSSYTIATVLSLQTLCTCIAFTLGQYIYAFYLQTYSLSSHEIQNSTNVTISTYLHEINHTTLHKCTKNGIAMNNHAQAWAQQRSADLFFWTNLWGCCPIIVMTYILGIYTPKLGRRFVLILPMIGIAIQFSIWLSIIYFHLPESWWYIAAFIVGLSGSDNIRSIDFEGFLSLFTVNLFFLFRFCSEFIYNRKYL